MRNSKIIESIKLQMTHVKDPFFHKLVEDLIEEKVNGEHIIYVVNKICEVRGIYPILIESLADDPAEEKFMENLMEITREYVDCVSSGKIIEDGNANVSRWDEFKSKVESFAEQFEEEFPETEEYLTDISEFAQRKFKEEGWLIDEESKPVKDIVRAIILVTSQETDDGIILNASIHPDAYSAEADASLFEQNNKNDNSNFFNYDMIHTTVDVSKYARTYK